MKNNNKSRSVLLTVIAVSVVLVAAVLVRVWTGQTGSGQFQGARGATPVVTATVKVLDFANSVEAVGTARANESVEVMTRVTDTISRIAFEDAGTVEAGDILVELTDAEEAAALVEARAGQIAASRHYERVQDLVKNRTTSQARLDEALSERDRSRARVKALEARMADRIITAPFAGVLGLRQVSVGSLVRPGDLITTLDDISLIKLDFSVSERYLGELAAGQSIVAHNVAWPGVAFKGEVRSIDNRIDPVTRAVMVRAILPNPERLLRPGMLLSIELIVDSRRAPGVPEGALIPVKDTVSVWVVDGENQVQKRAVVTGLRVKGQVEILDGLMEGEDVVVEGVHVIRRSGQKVKPAGDDAGEPGDKVGNRASDRAGAKS